MPLFRASPACVDPAVPDTLPALVDGTISFTKRAESVSNGDVSDVIEVSSTLGAAPEPWTPVVPDENDATTISYTLPPGQPRHFVRLCIVIPE